MRKVILNLAVSLDGVIEGPNGEFDWCFTDQDYGMKNFLTGTDTIFFGRKSYEVLTRTEKDPYPTMRKFVFSRTLQSVMDATVIQENIESHVKSIKEEPGKDIWLFGGAELTAQLMSLNLVDELQLAVHPILLGRGKRLFPSAENRVSLRLVDTKIYSTGLVQLFYNFVRRSLP